MTSHAIKVFVQHLFADRDFRQRFLAAPHEALADQPVTAEERRALLRLRTRLALAGGAGDLTAGPEIAWP